MGAFQERRQALVILGVLLVAAVTLWTLNAGSRGRVVEAGFWFEAVTFDATEVEADRLGGGLSASDLQRIETVAVSELRDAFTGMRIRFTDNPDASFRVRVVQSLTHPVFRNGAFAGESRGMWPFGGQGTLNFRLLASTAIAYAPPGTEREDKVEAIGRGIGRAAAHEFAHQILGKVDIHRQAAKNTYEYRSADRAEQYYGPMQWGRTGPLLERRLGLTPQA